VSNAGFIDFSSRPPLPEFTKTGRHLDNYRRVYSAGEKAADAELPKTASLPEYLAMYERLGASRVVIKARDLETTFGFRIANEDVATFCKAHAPRFIGFAGVDPHKGVTALASSSLP